MSERNDSPHDATRLVRAASDLFGREGDLQAIEEALRQHRVVCIAGPPGVGKSRLARVFARSRGRHTVVDLAGFASGVERELAVALGADAPSQEPVDALADRLDQLLLAQDERIVVLDNADQVASLERLLKRFAALTTAVRFVVTRRQRVDASGVTTVRIGGLGPAEGRELFVARAQGARPDFVPDDVASIDAVVRLVDGLPLAIELAAARIRVMAPASLAQRVGERIDVLKSRGVADARHDSLRAAFDDSWDMLDPAQQRVLAGCAAFEGWFDLEAAEDVVQPHVDDDVIDLVEMLIEASLVQSAFVGGALRFQLLRTVREYARAQWIELGLGAALAAAHDRHLVRRAETLAARVLGGGGAAAFAEIDAEREAFLGALDRFVAAGDLEAARRLLIALRWHVVLRGPLERFENAFQAVLRDAGAAAPDHATIAATYAEALVLRGDRNRAIDVLDQAPKSLATRRVETMARTPPTAAALCQTLEALVEDARRSGEQFAQAQALERLGLAQTQANDIDRAWMSFTEARDLYRGTGATLFGSGCATGLGYVELRLGRLDGAIDRFADAVRGYDATADHFLAATARFNLGVALCNAGRPRDGRAELELAIDAWRAGGFVRYCVPGLVRLGLAQLECGDVEVAWSTFSEAVRLGTECQDHHNAAIAYVERAALDHGRRRPVDFDELERMTPGIAPGADPDAFASALVLLGARAAQKGRAALGYVNRLEELAAMFAESDTYVRSVVAMLRDIARAWHCLETARTATEESDRRQHIARAWEWGAALTAGRVDIQNPFVRLWAARLEDFGGEFAAFADQRALRAVLVVHTDGDWYQVDERSPVDLSTRRPLRLLMRRLVELYRENPHGALDVDGLAAAGWPGEELQLATRRNRVYTAVRFLREMDLEEVLVKDDEGYRFAADVAISITDGPIEA